MLDFCPEATPGTPTSGQKLMMTSSFIIRLNLGFVCVCVDILTQWNEIRHVVLLTPHNRPTTQIIPYFALETVFWTKHLFLVFLGFLSRYRSQRPEI